MEPVAAVDAALTRDVALALAVCALALLLFVWNRVRPDVVAGIVATVLMVSGLLTPAEAVSGFGNEATIIVGLLLVLSAALLRTGAVEQLGLLVGRIARDSELRLLVAVLLLVVPLSAFVNNTAAVAVLLPLVIGLARNASFSASRVLMPLSFAGQLGGTLTLIGSSTNLVVAGLVVQLGLGRIRLFDITPPAFAMVLVGVLYLLTVGRWLLPHREPVADLLESYELHDYLASIRVGAESSWVGRTIAHLRLRETEGLNVVAIEREDGSHAVPVASTVINPGDMLLVEGTIAALTALRDVSGVDLGVAETAAGWPAAPVRERADREEDDPLRTAEIMVPRRSHAAGRTLRQIGFRARYQIGAIGLRRHGQPLHEPLADVVLRTGDLLLVQGRASALRALHEEGELALVGAVEVPVRRRNKMRIAIAIMVGVVAMAALGIAPILASAMVGTSLVFLTGCLTAEEAYEDVDWSVIVLIGALLPLGMAMQRSGAAAFLAGQTLDLAAPLGLYGLLAAVYLLTVALTSMISNAAAAVILTPVAAAVATGAGSSPLPFVVAVMFAASNAFLTPVGYQTNLFVYGPGGYRFGDYFRLGAPLTALTAAVATLVVPVFFPFRAG
ncbi:MAG TPA: SLC13 family permease [Longimicrobiales bacterium]|nr:SLC13 family permease [Longimicrobiales bacterium]